MRVRRKWRHLSSAEIGDEFCTFPCQNVHFRERYRERERERESDGSNVTLVALKLAKSFALFLAKNLHLFLGPPLEWRWVHTSVARKYVALFETIRILRRFCQMAWQGIEAPKQTIEFPAAPSFFSSKKWIKLIPKATGNRKRDGGCAHYVMVSKFQWKPFWLATQRDPQNDWTATQNRVNYDVFAQAPLCVRLRSGDKHHLRKSADRKAQIRTAFVPLTGLICAFRSEDFLR